MRVEDESVQKVTGTVGDSIETMRVLREMKNNFKGWIFSENRNMFLQFNNILLN